MTKIKTDIKNVCDNFIDFAMEFNDIPGISIGVKVGDKHYTTCAGYSNYGSKSPLHEEDIFHCVSISKLFTAAAIIKLAKDGRLELTKKIRNMIKHISLIGDVADYNWARPEFDDYALARYAASEEVTKAIKQGEKHGFEGPFRYSNIAYDLLGYEIEKASGQSFEKYMESNILHPCGMTDSNFFTPYWTGGKWSMEDIDASRLAMPHIKNQDNRIVVASHYPYNRIHAPSSTLTSNPSELLKWADVVLDRLEFNSDDELLEAGWHPKNVAGRKLYGHDGADDGFRGSFWICPEEMISVVVLANMDSMPTGALSDRLFKALVSDKNN